jgi:DNA-binding CsgD family transcriptional regulator
VNRSEFWQDYLIPGGCRYLLGTRLKRCEGRDVFFGLHRAPGQSAFSDAELEFARRITGHFQTAASLWLHTERLRQHVAIGVRALDALDQGVLALDSHGRLIFANRYGDALLRSGQPLKQRQGAVTVTQAEHAQAFAAALRQCRLSGRPHALRLGACEDSGKPAAVCTVTVLSVSPRSGLADRLFAAELLVLVTHGRHRRVLAAQMLMQLFGLTPAEARLARALAAGESLESYSRTAGVRLPTARTQLKAVFEKTGINRQSELVRQITIVPAVRG